MFSKLFSSIVGSSLWSQDSDTCKVWITLLALQDREGYVFATVSGLARLAALPVETVRRALEAFESPSPDSSDRLRCPLRQGRRIEAVEGGWRLLNSTFYRDLRDPEERRSAAAERQRRHRRHALSRSVTLGHKKSHAPSISLSSSPNSSPSVQALFSLKESGRARARAFKRPSLDELDAYVRAKGYHVDTDRFMAFYDSNGWKVGKNPMKSWKAALFTWHAKGD